MWLHVNIGPLMMGKQAARACASQIQAEANTPSTFDHVVLSSDGKLIAAAVGGALYLLDAFQGAVKARFATGRPDQASAGFEPSFSPDSQYLSSGAARLSSLCQRDGAGSEQSSCFRVCPVKCKGLLLDPFETAFAYIS